MQNSHATHNESDDADLLWQLTGARSGPTLLVTGAVVDLMPVVDRLRLLPSLVYLRGTLCVAGNGYHAPADALLCLEGVAQSELYVHILSRAAELGMISGRGIPMDLPEA